MASPHTRPRRAPMPPFEYLLEKTSDAPAADPARPSPRHRQRAEGCGRIDHTFHCQKTSIHTDFKSNIQNSKSPNTYWFHIEQNLKSSIQISKSPNTYWFHIEHKISKSNIPISYLITYALLTLDAQMLMSRSAEPDHWCLIAASLSGARTHRQKKKQSTGESGCHR